MTDWLFQATPKRSTVGYDSKGHLVNPAPRTAGSSIIRYRDQIAMGDRAWLQTWQQTGEPDHAIGTLATIYELYEWENDWYTNIRLEYRVDPPLLAAELLGDPVLGSFGPFREFQCSNVPLPPPMATRLSELASPRLVPFGPSATRWPH